MNDKKTLRNRNLIFIGAVILTFVLSWLFVSSYLNMMAANSRITSVLDEQKNLGDLITSLVGDIQSDLYSGIKVGSRNDSLALLISTWANDHNEIIESNLKYAGTKAMVNSCDSLLQLALPHFSVMVNGCKNLVANPTPDNADQALEMIYRHQPPNRNLITQCIKRYETELEESIGYLKFIQLALSLIGIAFLVLGYMFFILPTINRLARSNQDLVESHAAITTLEEETRSNLEQLQSLQATLEMREQQYRNLVENASDIIYELNDQGKFVFVNPVIERVIGYKSEELINKFFWEAIHPDHATHYGKIYLEIIKRQEEFSYLEIPVLTKSGSTVWLGQNSRLFYDAGRVTRVAVVSRDISKQRNAEAEAKKAKEIAEALTLNTATVEDYRKEMLRKTKTRNVAELVSFAHRNGLL